MQKVAIFWFRRDLRLEDNAGLYHALKSGYPVLPLFIFDRNILDKLTDKKDQRVSFIYQTVIDLHRKLQSLGTTLLIEYGTPFDVWSALLHRSDFSVAAVYTNHDYEPYAIARDATIAEYLLSEGIRFHSFKDQCIFEKNEVMTGEGRPYTVFTPYSRKWLEKLRSRGDFYVKSYPTEKYFGNFFKMPATTPPTLAFLGFSKSKKPIPPAFLNEDIVRHYEENRNFPALQGTTRIGVHLRFGTLSIRAMARKALELSMSWLNELIWRDFYMMILSHFPAVVTQNFQSKYDSIRWRNNPDEFAAWCEGRTGYPIVDAG
ncbi:MAG: deoxyribodipyrimidine photo-lyase, partial [Flammeovirgaceae bacterium]|nr:deoxyribodipyrimidine photo-lyase [Flammeovirgaceae bacterium]